VARGSSLARVIHGRFRPTIGDREIQRGGYQGEQRRPGQRAAPRRWFVPVVEVGRGQAGARAAGSAAKEVRDHGSTRQREATPHPTTREAREPSLLVNERLGPLETVAAGA
jgi:hypothetical protein